MVICNKCTIDKPTSEFYKDKKRSTGITRWCKQCMGAQNKKWKNKNKNKVKAYMDTYREENKEPISEQRRIYRRDNLDHIKKKEREYRENNKDKVKEWKREYYKKTANDPHLRIQRNLSNRIRKVLIGINKSSTTMKLLGCDLPTFINHIQEMFVDGMNWENYGEWHLDHIVPCSHFNLENESEQRVCFHYTNLQPLWAKDNCSKQDRWIG